MKKRHQEAAAYAGIIAAGVAFGVARTPAGKAVGIVLSVLAFSALARSEELAELNDDGEHGGTQRHVEDNAREDAGEPQDQRAEVAEHPAKGTGAENGKGGNAGGGDFVPGLKDVPGDIRLADEAAFPQGEHVGLGNPADRGGRGGAIKEKAEKGGLRFVHGRSVAQAGEQDKGGKL